MAGGNVIPTTPASKRLVIQKEKALEAALNCITTAKNILLKKIEEEECPFHDELFRSINNSLHLIKTWENPNYLEELEKKHEEEHRASLIICKHCSAEYEFFTGDVTSLRRECAHCGRNLLG